MQIQKTKLIINMLSLEILIGQLHRHFFGGVLRKKTDLKTFQAFTKNNYDGVYILTKFQSVLRIFANLQEIFKSTF